MAAAPLHTAVREPRRAVPGTPPLLLALHGYGSDEADLLGLADALDPRLRVVSARAPLRLDQGGHAWFPLDVTPGGIVADVEAEARSLGQLGQLLTQVQASGGHTGADTLVLGFSQGGAMALGLLLARPDDVAGVAFLSGLWSTGRMPQDGATRAAVGGKPVLQTHGLQDPLIPIARARRTRELLEELGVDLTYREYPMAHQIDAGCLRDIAAWIATRLDASGPPGR